MFAWLFSWEEAAKHPWKSVISAFLIGFVGAGLVGYFLLGNRTVGWGVALGLGAGLVCSAYAWRTVRDPVRVAELTERLGDSLVVFRWSIIRLALPFLALGIATAGGAAFHSLTVFMATLAAGLVAALVLRRLVPR